MKGWRGTDRDSPSTGTEEAVGGAASTKINSSTKKLANMLMAEKWKTCYRWNIQEKHAVKHHELPLTKSCSVWSIRWQPKHN